MVEFIKYRGFDHVFEYSGPWLWWLVAFYLCLPFLAYFVLPFLTSKGTFSGKRRTISIFVLGDLGHSPRMNYHARSFANHDYYVNLCGYLESQPPVEVVDDIDIEIFSINAIKNIFNLPFILFALQKVTLQIYQLFKLLFKFRGSRFIMIQNPPSLPILLISIIFIKLFSRETELIVDWHNLNYSILNLKYNNWNHPLVVLLKNYEKYLGRFADYNITVTKKMKEYLVNEFGFDKRRIITLHDRPADQFKPLQQLNTSKQDILKSYDIFTSVKDVEKYKILVSSTSFTPDEDFNVLLDALKQYDDISSTKDLPPLLVIVTGKGPLKEQFLKRIDHLKFLERVLVKSAWLPIEDYPVILSVADVGISLHTSSSGIDLPMKIVDFFGVGIPVITLGFPAIHELVHEGVNGLIANLKDDSVPIADEMYRLIIRVFDEPGLLDTLKKGALLESGNTWDHNWEQKMGHVFSYDLVELGDHN